MRGGIRVRRRKGGSCPRGTLLMLLQQGVMARNDLGFILWDNNEVKTMGSNLVSGRCTDARTLRRAPASRPPCSPSG